MVMAIYVAWWMIGCWMAMGKFRREYRRDPNCGESIDVAIYGLVEPVVQFRQWIQEL